VLNRNRSNSVTVMQKTTLQISFRAINIKSPAFRNILYSSKLLQNAFNIVAVHNLIFLGEICLKFSTAFPVKERRAGR